MPSNADDLAALHDACACDPNCDLCAAETAEDEAPGGQCAEGVCVHDDCMEQRAADDEDSNLAQ